jgi:phosphatidylserine/phosphatidylglycerophosphate/cardiolipin synthase-like enzyme
MYLQAVNNVTNFIYIENQYFRWPPLADKICRVAKARKEAGCQDPIYLFVITNSTDAGVGKGTVNTYRMLNALGRADTIPEVARQERAEDLQAKLGQARQKEQVAQVNYNYSSYPGATDANNPRQVKAKAELERARAERKKAEQALEAAQQKDAPIPVVERPGLKTHICTLVAPDTLDGMDWMEVYIHAKLMIVNDTFLTLGSANINTRSMQVDSELNIALDRPEITKPLRQKLWQLHTNAAHDNAKEAFVAWTWLLGKNQAARSNKQKPLASLLPFLRTDPARSNSD